MKKLSNKHWEAISIFVMSMCGCALLCLGIYTVETTTEIILLTQNLSYVYMANLGCMFCFFGGWEVMASFRELEKFKEKYKNTKDAHLLKVNK